MIGKVKGSCECVVWLFGVGVEVVVECGCWKRLMEVVIGGVKGSCEW